MGIENIENLFRPRSIAVIGASDRKGAIGSALMQNLQRFGFKGNVYPVNHKRSHVMGLPAAASVLQIEDEVDLVLVSVPLAAVPAIMTECGEAGVKGAVILSAGGKEIGPEGSRIEADIAAQAQRYGIRVIGPNCLGIIRTATPLNASFAGRMPPAGRTAFLSQSGAICTAVLDLAVREGVGFSYFVSLGSMIDVDFADMIDFLGGEPEVTSIVMYVESISRMREFMSAARAVSRIKPIVALKAGRTKAGAAAAASHTGAMAGEDRVYNAAFQRAGIVRVKTFEELFDCAELLAKQPKPAGPRLVIVTNAGGPGVMAADALADHGFEPATLGRDTIAKLNAILPAHWSRANPIDVTGDAAPLVYRRVVEICMQADEADALLVMSAPQIVVPAADLAEAVTELLRDRSFPVFTCWLGGSDMDAAKAMCNRAGLPTFDSPERAVRAFMDLFQYKRRLELLREIPAKVNRRLEFDRDKGKTIVAGNASADRRRLSDKETFALLGAYGIPVNRTETARTQEEAAEKARAIGFPVAVKICSGDISHKSDAGGVALNLHSGEAVKRAYQIVVQNARARHPNAQLEGVTVQPMIAAGPCELIMGITRDRDFGPVLLFGSGGVLTEIMQDVALALPPLNRPLARQLIESTRIHLVLKGYRNLAPVDIALVEDTLIRLSQLAVDFAEIQELDINPVAVSQGRLLALDARVVLRHPETPAPMHLVIATYPVQYETRVRTATGMDIFVRPIRPEDAGLLGGLFEALSPRSVYLRFFTPLNQFPHSMLARFTQIDYDREIALVALPAGNPESRILGVARIIMEPNPRRAEFSIVVGDAWQGKGIGAALLERCLSIAQARGVELIWGTALAENTQMLRLARKLGFSVKRQPDVNEIELRLDMTKTAGSVQGAGPAGLSAQATP